MDAGLLPGVQMNHCSEHKGIPIRFKPLEICSSDLDKIVLVKPKQNNKRILAQAGAFFAFGMTEELENNNTSGIKIDRIRIDANSKIQILNDLDKLGFNDKTLFPEVDRAARYITGSLRFTIADLLG